MEGLEKLMPGTGACSLSDAIVLTKHAVDLGCGGVLMLPPFYYKAPSEDGLFRFFAEAIEEIDLNPVIVHPEGHGFTVVDALTDPNSSLFARVATLARQVSAGTRD